MKIIEILLTCLLFSLIASPLITAHDADQELPAHANIGLNNKKYRPLFIQWWHHNRDLEILTNKITSCYASVGLEDREDIKTIANYWNIKPADPAATAWDQVNSCKLHHKYKCLVDGLDYEGCPFFVQNPDFKECIQVAKHKAQQELIQHIHAAEDGIALYRVILDQCYFLRGF